MNKQMIIILSIIGLLLILPSVFASVSTVSTSMSTSRATTGTSITSTVTVTATGTESGSVQLTCTPSGITISDPSSGQYQGVSLSTSPTSKTFTLTAGTANTYTCSGQSGGVSGDATIVFVDPSALTATGTPSSKSTTSGTAFSLSINLQNSQSDAITTSYSLSSCGGSPHTCSGDSTSSTITVAAGTTTSLAWTVTTGTSSGTLTFSLGDNSNAFSTSVTCTNCTTTTTDTTTTDSTTPGLTTQDVKVTTAKGNATIIIPSIAAGKSKVVKINKTEDLAFRQIEVFVKNSVNIIQITITKLPDRPATITQEITGKVYHYIQVDKNVSDTSVNQTVIRFEVEKSWISTNNINKSTIKLYRYENSAWNKLQTSELSEDSTTITYEAISPGLSVFAIGAEATSTTTEQPTTTEQQPTEEKKGITEITKGKSWIILLVLIVGGIAGVVFYLVKKNVIKLGKVPLRKSNWDDLKKKYSRK